MATATFVQRGENIDYVAAANTAYMEVVPLAARIGVALEAIAKRLIQMAEHGNLKAIMLLLDILGESPRYQLQKDMLELKRRELKLREQGW